jgi:hypothetical protein
MGFTTDLDIGKTFIQIKAMQRDSVETEQSG